MRVTFRTGIAICAVALVIVGICAYVSYQYITTQKEWAYFTSATQGVSENVTVSGVPYIVQNGVVTEQSGGQPAKAQQLAALRLAYALTLARRDPLFDLAGNNVSNLRSATTDLARAQKEIEQLQASSTDVELIANLDPISFLSALADVEQARETFIASGKDTDEQSYEAKLNIAVSAGSTDIQNFKSAYDEVGHPSYTLIAGVVQGSNIDAELQSIADGFNSVATQAKARSACIAGDVWSCDQGDIAIKLPQAAIATSTAPLPKVAQEVEQIFSATDYDESDGQVMLLPSDPCVANLDAPPYFEALQRYPTRILFLGDMYFTDVGTGEYASGLFHNLGVSYLFYNPITYYTCIENGLVYAQTRTVSAISMALDGTSTAPVINYQDEVGELGVALQNATPQQQKAFLDIYLMAKDNDGAFPSVIEDIAGTENIDISQKEAGVPTDIDPTFLFSAKSGFYDLFMAYNPSFGSKPTDLYSNAQANPILSTLIPWSQLSGSVPMKKIESDLNAYIAYHVNPTSIAGALPTSTGPAQAPAGMKTYQSSLYGFSLFYPDDLTVTEDPGSDDTMVVAFDDSATHQGFQIYIAPDPDPKITQQRFQADEPSGVMNDPVNITLDGIPATEFGSTNTAMGESEEIWFLYNGYLYEVTAPQTLASWLLQVMETWQFN